MDRTVLKRNHFRKGSNNDCRDGTSCSAAQNNLKWRIMGFDIDAAKCCLLYLLLLLLLFFFLVFFFFLLLFFLFVLVCCSAISLSRCLVQPSSWLINCGCQSPRRSEQHHSAASMTAAGDGSLNPPPPTPQKNKTKQKTKKQTNKQTNKKKLPVAHHGPGTRSVKYLVSATPIPALPPPSPNRFYPWNSAE